jgi:hypothetical protein
MSWIEPLKLETWFSSVLSGSPEVFLGLALLFIGGLAAYFRMPGITFFFMIGLFLLMFSAFIETSLTVLIFVITALIIGIFISKIIHKYL